MYLLVSESVFSNCHFSINTCKRQRKPFFPLTCNLVALSSSLLPELIKLTYVLCLYMYVCICISSAIKNMFKVLIVSQPLWSPGDLKNICLFFLIKILMPSLNLSSKMLRNFSNYMCSKNLVV